MGSNYWIKLYHEILHDPKMGLLPDNVWRRAIELFLLAGELDQAGVLPETAELAWLLRRPNGRRFQAELEQLQQAGILQPLEAGWLVVHFAARQAAVSEADRMKGYRQRKRGAPPVPRPSEVASPEAPAGPPLSERLEVTFPGGGLPASEQPEACRLPGVTEGVTTRNADKDRDTDKDLLSNDNGGVPPPPPLDQFQKKVEEPEEEAPPPGVSLEPDTPESRLLFVRINCNRSLRKHGPVQRFKSLEQKQKCLEAAARLGYSRFEDGLNQGLQKGLVDLASLVNWLAKWDVSGRAYNNPPAASASAWVPARATGLGAPWTEEELREMGFDRLPALAELG